MKNQLDTWKETNKKRIEEEQKRTHLEGYLRVRYGDEEHDWGADENECDDCSVIKGQIHILGCDLESCPICKKQLISCGHFKEYLPKASNLGFFPVYDNPAKKEYFFKFLKITSMDNLEEKFLIFQRKDQGQKLVLYCDKVLVGETLRQAIERVLKSNFGIEEVYDIFVEPKEESAANKYGEILPRAVVSSTVVKYAPLTVSSSFIFSVEWVNSKEFKKLFLNTV